VHPGLNFYRRAATSRKGAFFEICEPLFLVHLYHNLPPVGGIGCMCSQERASIMPINAFSPEAWW
jgi:hypothetical protein